MHRNSRRQPLFAISIWNCYDGVKEGIPKTNNYVEGWHRKFSTLLGADHPSIWKFIDNLKNEQSLNELELNQLISGTHPIQRNKTYKDVAKKISNIVGKYQEMPILDYLKGISNNLKLQV